ncbi:DCC1-like thiol-disulfide oxidoreductase family protein [Tundrisphaera sp. TA3]|uniref:DCC1-like thiol-disulfide oxidoreductase family protein n=1 Tax=Tundrisphaera sp. TA3 TaxID=3435775 RepID=UPI003EBFF1B0
MQRFLNGLVGVPAALAGSIARGWDRFLFTPADPTPLGLIRVLVGGLLTWSMLVYGLDLHAFFGRQGWANLETVLQFRSEQGPGSWSFWFYVPDAMLRPVWIACVAVLAAFTLGLWSRTTAVLAWIIVVSTARRAPISLYGFDNIASTWALYLAVSGASGQAVSLDRMIARYSRSRAEVATRRKDGLWTAPSGVPSPSISANLGLRLIQCHLVLIYGLSGLSKLRGNPWWEGTAIWGTIAAGEFRLFDLTWLAAFPFLLNAMTHAAVALEVGYPALVWVRPIRPFIVAAAMMMHAAIGLTLGLFEFGLAMIAGNLAFASGPWLRSLASGLEQPSGRVLYDGACPRCRASMALITAMDPDRVIEPVDLTAVDVATIHHGLTKEECLRAMHLVRSDGVVEVGYEAVMRILGWTPLGRMPAMVRYVPGVSWVGRRVYNRIAATRPRDGSCNDEACGIHPPGGRRPADGRPASTQPGKVTR